MTRDRIVRLIIASSAFALLLILGLSEVMVASHEDWLERSYRNRWAFRDVPTRRGTIFDRNDAVVARDEPGFDLEIRYRTFRRHHPVGVAVHGANRLARTLGRRPKYRLDRPEGWAAACREVLEIPLGLLGPESGVASRSLGASREANAEDARDLRFYASSLLSRVSGVGAHHFHLGLRHAIEDRRTDPVWRIGLEVCRGRGDTEASIELTAFREIGAELREFGRRIGSDSFDMLAYLESRRQAWIEWRDWSALPEDERAVLLDAQFWASLASEGLELEAWREFAALDSGERAARVAAFRDLDDDAKAAFEERERPVLPWNEDVPRVARNRLPYRHATWLKLLQDRHPGFRMQPSVRRAYGTLPGRDDLGTLELLIGRVSPMWKEHDDAGLRAWTRGLGESGLEGFFENWDSDLPGDLSSSLVETAGEAMRRHYLTQGRVGRSGIESAVDGVLAGAPGLRFVERTRRREKRLFSSLDVVAGRDVRLTLDLRLQALLEDSLATAEFGVEKAAAILDARTGDVLAVAGWPLVDKEGKPRWISAATWPSKNPYIGSVVKPFVLLEHLDAQRHGRPTAPPKAFRPCVGRYSKRLRCGSTHGPAALDPIEALGRSCNFFFFTAVRGLGNAGLRRALSRVGLAPLSEAFARRPLVGGPAYETKIGGLPSGASARPKLSPSRWELEMQGIGYGVEVNVVFIARAYAALAAGSVPTVSFVRDGIPRARVPLGVHAGDLEQVRAGLAFCVSSGSARRVDWHNVRVFGKTGTAEVRVKPSKRNNAWFAGYTGPARDAQLAFACVLYDVPHGSGGGRVAAPVVADFLRRVREDPQLAEAYLPESVR